MLARAVERIARAASAPSDAADGASRHGWSNTTARVPCQCWLCLSFSIADSRSVPKPEPQLSWSGIDAGFVLPCARRRRRSRASAVRSNGRRATIHPVPEAFTRTRPPSACALSRVGNGWCRAWAKARRLRTSHTSPNKKLVAQKSGRVAPPFPHP